MGLFFKIGLADNLALYVDRHLNEPQYSNGISTFFSIIFYNFQIYGRLFINCNRYYKIIRI